MKEACRRHLPEGEYSIFVNGHSTGGPLVPPHIMLQRIVNVVGMADAEGSPFGYVDEQKQAWSGAVGKIGETGGKVTTKGESRRARLMNSIYGHGVTQLGTAVRGPSEEKERRP